MKQTVGTGQEDRNRIVFETEETRVLFELNSWERSLTAPTWLVPRVSTGFPMSLTFGRRNASFRYFPTRRFNDKEIRTVAHQFNKKVLRWGNSNPTSVFFYGVNKQTDFTWGEWQRSRCFLSEKTTNQNQLPLKRTQCKQEHWVHLMGVVATIEARLSPRLMSEITTCPNPRLFQ